MANAFAFDDDEEKPRKKARRPADDEDEEEERPRPKKKPLPVKAKPKRPVDEDEEDEEERPRPKKKPAKPVDVDEEEDEDDDDDDDEEEERPTRKKGKNRKKNAKGNKMPFLLIGGGMALLLFLVCGGFGGWYFFLRETPERAFNSVQSAFENKDFGVLYDRMPNEERALMIGFMELAKADPVKGAQFKNLTGRDLFVAVMKESAKEGKNTFNSNGYKGKVEGSEINGDTATLTVRLNNGSTEKVRMVKQDGTWRVGGRPTSGLK